MILVTVLYILVCILLVVVVLLQQGKGAGLGIIGGSSDTILGSNAGNVFTKTTSYLAILFIIGAIMLSVLGSGKRSAIDKEEIAPPNSSIEETAAPEEGVTEEVELSSPISPTEKQNTE